MVAVHVVAGLLAVALGGFVVLTRKGVAWHVRIGWCYAIAMLVLVVSSFGIYRVSGSLTVFHGISISTTFALVAGLMMPRLRHRVSTWVVWHLRLMLTSYLMLIMTMTAQFFDYLPLPSAALNAIVFLQLPTIAGLIAISRAADRAAVGDPAELP